MIALPTPKKNWWLSTVKTPLNIKKKFENAITAILCQQFSIILNVRLWRKWMWRFGGPNVPRNLECCVMWLALSTHSLSPLCDIVLTYIPMVRINSFKFLRTYCTISIIFEWPISKRNFTYVNIFDLHTYRFQISNFLSGYRWVCFCGYVLDFNLVKTGLTPLRWLTTPR